MGQRLSCVRVRARCGQRSGTLSRLRHRSLAQSAGLESYQLIEVVKRSRRARCQPSFRTPVWRIPVSSLPISTARFRGKKLPTEASEKERFVFTYRFPTHRIRPQAFSGARPLAPLRTHVDGNPGAARMVHHVSPADAARLLPAVGDVETRGCR